MESFIILEDLPVEERLKILERQSRKGKDIAIGNDSLYKAIYSNSLRVNNTLMTNTKIENVIKLTTLQNTDTNIVFDIDILKNKIHDGLEYFAEEYMDIVNGMSKIREHIVCSVDTKGIVTKIFNMKELKEKWYELKENIKSNKSLTEKIKPSDLTEILNAGEKEYVNNGSILVDEMNQHNLYIALFSGFMKTKEKMERQFTSNILPNNNFTVICKLMQEYDDEKTFTYSITADNVYRNNSSLKKAFKKNYYMLQEDFRSHSFDMFILNTVDKNTKWLESAKYTINEKINESIEVVIICEIEKIVTYE